MITLLNESTWTILVIMGILLLGVLLFFLSGWTRVPKGHIALIEKVGVYFGTYEEGWHYFFPFLYRRVAVFSKKPYVHRISIQQQVIEIRILIINPHDYFYSGVPFIDICKNEAEKDWDNLKDYIASVQESLNKIGCQIVGREHA